MRGPAFQPVSKVMHVLSKDHTPPARVLPASPGIAVAVLLIHVPEGGVLLEKSTCRDEHSTTAHKK